MKRSLWEKNRKQWLRKGLLFLVPPLVMLAYERFRLGQIGNMTADGRLYLSIADNFLATGHFIQTERWFPGLVVPPVVPLTVLVLRFLGFSEKMLVLFHAFLFGLANVMLGETEKRLTGTCGVAGFVYLLAYMRCRLLLGNLLVEHYYLFLLCALLWLVFRPMEYRKKILLMNLLAVLLFMTRPALLPVYLVILCYSVFVIWRGRQFLLGWCITLIPIVFLLLNLLVNFRETGELILLESYSGTDLYITASENAPVTPQEANDYDDELRDSIFYDPELTMSEKSRILNGYAREYIRSHFGSVCIQSVERFYQLFIRCYLFLTVPAAVGGFLFALNEKNRRQKTTHFCLLALNLFMAGLTSFGLPEIRYTAVIWPLASLHCAEALNWGLNKVRANTAS